MTRAELEAGNPGFFYLDPRQPEALAAYLADVHALGPGESVRSVATAGQGNMNCAVRVATDRRTLVLKQARPWVERYPQFAAPWDRARGEAEFYRLIAERPVLAARMPRLLFADAEMRLIGLEDLGTGGDHTGLYRGEVLADASLDALASYLSTLHGAFAGHPARRTLANREMRELNHAHVFRIPLQPDNGLDLDAIQPGLAAVADVLKRDADYCEAVARLGRDGYLADGESLVHGDFFPGSFLRSADGPKVIDPEFGYFGRPEFDAGVFLAHLLLARQPARLAARFLETYRPPVPVDEGVMLQFAGIEVMRRLIGYAQLPLVCAVETKRALLEQSRALVLTPSKERLLSA